MVKKGALLIHAKPLAVLKKRKRVSLPARFFCSVRSSSLKIQARTGVSQVYWFAKWTSSFLSPTGSFTDTTRSEPETRP